MVETIILAMIISKVKGYNLKPVLRCWAFYPVMIFTMFYIFLDINIFLENYSFVKYSNIFETAYLSMFFILIFKFNLYGCAIIGSITIFVGTSLNKIAIYMNNGKMPVFPTLSYITGYFKPDCFSKVNDIHILGNEATKLKFLTDYIDIGYSILSIGDIFIRFFTFIIIFNAIKCVNKNNTEEFNV